MKKIIVIITALFAAQAVHSLAGAQVGIVPQPVSVNWTGDGVFTFDRETVFNVVPGNFEEELARAAETFLGYLDPVLGYRPSSAIGVAGPNSVNLVVAEGLGAEEYEMGVNRETVFINGGSPQAVFLGMQTLRQLIAGSPRDEAGNVAIPAVQIADEPFFGYRAMHLDVCRHFRTVDEVKEYIDILALHKMNNFHFHLTDDQGWRIDIKAYPELARVASQRDRTLIGHGAWPPFEYDYTPHGGYYTQDELRDIVRYAADRYINVIPEIEMPGHAVAALAAYPNLGCVGEGYEVWPRWGVHDDVFCAGKEETFEFIEAVLSEVADIFPSQIIHIGGDECPKVRWKECPHCQARMVAEGLADEDELQSYFMHRAEKMLTDRGRSIIGWDEILDGGVSPTAIVMSWRGSRGGIEAAKNGNYVIMVPNVYCYFDFYQSDPQTEPFAIGGLIPVDKVYQFDPYEGLDENERQYILGVQANLWCEYIPTFEKAQYMVLPRMAALCETGWSYDRKDYEDFLGRVETMRKIYEAHGYNYARHIFEDR